jgi:hypothetical protein
MYMTPEPELEPELEPEPEPEPAPEPYSDKNVGTGTVFKFSGSATLVETPW